MQWQVKVELEPISSPTAVHFTQLSITWCLPTLQDSTGLKQRNHADIPCLFMMEMLAPIRQFLSDPGKPGVRSLGPDVYQYLTKRPCVDLTDVTLADEDTNSILTDGALG